MMSSIRLFGLLSLVLLAAAMNTAQADSQVANEVAERCQALAHADFSVIPDAPTQVTATTLSAPTGDSPGYCEILGRVAPPIEFLLRLPSEHWNGKLIELGCGGPCGTLAHIQECGEPLRRGYACVVSDGGHKVDPSSLMSWADRNPQAVVQYYLISHHVTALAAKHIVQHYYRHGPRHSYFMGCSSGGIQAMLEAQHFPLDFDGIVAGGPALSLSRNWLNWLWANRALNDADGKAVLEHADLELLHRAVVARCDLNDGVEDGVIGDPRACHFDVAELRCSAGKNSGCLTARQIEAAMKVYKGPVTSQGQKLVDPVALKGSELTWLDWFDGSSVRPTPMYEYFKDWTLYSIYPIELSAGWKPEQVDFDRDYKRLGAWEAMEPINNPNLQRFKAAGGKLLSYTGWSDAIEGVLGTTGYYETVEKVMGGRQETQDFYRLFVVPGMYHCEGGEGADVIDYLSHLEAWVEEGKAPASLLGAHLRSSNTKGLSEQRRRRFPLDPAQIEFSRPVYPYPNVTQYRGKGDSHDAANFQAVDP